MDNKTANSRKATDLTRSELATVIYHIATNTHVSMTYTRRFMRDALLQAAELLGKPVVPAQLSVQPYEDRASAFSNINESILHDYTVDGLTYKIPVKDDLQPRGLRGESVKYCIKDASITCHCSLSDILKCELSDDDVVPETCTFGANDVSFR